MTRKTYCGNLLWQSGLTLLAPEEECGRIREVGARALLLRWGSIQEGGEVRGMGCHQVHAWCGLVYSADLGAAICADGDEGRGPMDVGDGQAQRGLRLLKSASGFIATTIAIYLGKRVE